MRYAVLLAALILAGCGKPEPPSPAEKRWESAEAIQQAIANKTPDDVKAALGPPDTTLGDAWKDKSASWYYSRKVRNRATGKDDLAVIQFRQGRAVKAEAP